MTAWIPRAYLTAWRIWMINSTCLSSLADLGGEPVPSIWLDSLFARRQAGDLGRAATTPGETDRQKIFVTHLGAARRRLRVAKAVARGAMATRRQHQSA